MKKIRKLSLYKKKKSSASNEEDVHENEVHSPSSSSTKSPLGHSLRKKFFSKSAFIRSKSLPEGSLSVVNDSTDSDVFSEDAAPLKEENHIFLELNGNLPAAVEENDSSLDTENEKVEAIIESSEPAHSSNANNAKNSHSKANNLFLLHKDSQEIPDYDKFDATTAVSNLSANSLGDQSVLKDPRSSNGHPPSSDADEQPSSNDSTSPPPITTHRALYESYLICEFKKLSKQGWYWGPLSRDEAEEKLQELPDESFLVRDSSDERHLLSLSFRSYGRTLHTRIEHSIGKFSFYVDPDIQSFASVVDLIQHSVEESQHSGAFCYSRFRSARSPTLPVRLTYPVSRLSQVPSLQYLCRFAIRQDTRIDQLQYLPLPNAVKDYVKQPCF